MSQLILYFDGLCEPVNPGGVSCYGWVLYRDGEQLARGRGVAVQGGPQSTNNVAEYTALIEGLQAAREWHDAGELVEVRGDSQLAIRQMKGEYQVKSARIRPLHRKARELARQIGRVTWRWVPREQNEEADALSREAYQSVLEEAGVGEAEGLPSALP